MEDFKQIDKEKLRRFISDWFDYADNNFFNKVDASFLNKRVIELNDSVEIVKANLTKTIELLGGKVVW